VDAVVYVVRTGRGPRPDGQRGDHRRTRSRAPPPWLCRVGAMTSDGKSTAAHGSFLAAGSSSAACPGSSPADAWTTTTNATLPPAHH